MQRRAFLAVLGTTTVSAGCQGLLGCDPSADGELRCTRVQLTTEQRENVVPAVYGDLSTAERAIVDTAIEEERYRECPPFSEAFRTLSDTLIARVSEQTDTDSAASYLAYPYIRKGDVFYESYLGVGDQIYADV